MAQKQIVPLALLLLAGTHLGHGKLVSLQEDLEPMKLEDKLTGRYPDLSLAQTRDVVMESVWKFERPEGGARSSGRRPVGNKTIVIGTTGEVYHDRYDKGFFSTILNAYANHWTLVTGPEDWWFTILRKIAIAIDKKSKEPRVRDFFVSHKEGRKRLVVQVESVGGTDYNWFFNQMTNQIADNIKKPEYVSLARPSFSTTLPEHTIVADIALMSSLQEYFEYVLSIECGIPRIEMKGELEDWHQLTVKFGEMRNLLQELDILPNSWWESAGGVLEKLEATYKEENGTAAWWKGVVERHYGCGGPPYFSGWLVKDFLGEQPDEAPLGLVTVPLTIEDKGVKEQAAVVAGVAGFRVKEGQGGGRNETSVEANYAWGLLMEPRSNIRDSLV